MSRNRKKYVIWIGALAALMLIFFAAFYRLPFFSNIIPVPFIPIIERVLPQAVFQDYAGREIQLSDFRGNPIIINMWSSWCPYCIEELPIFSEIKKEFGEAVIILAVNRGETKEIAERYSNEIVPGNELVFLLDPKDSFYTAVGGFSMPETLFVNTEGKIILHRRGSMQKEEIRRRIQDEFHLNYD